MTIIKKINRKRYTQERVVLGKTEVYDSNTYQWVAIASVPEDTSSTSFSGGGGNFGGGGSSGSWGDSSSSSSCSSSDSSSSSSGGCD